MVFKSPRKVIPTLPNLVLGDDIIEKVDCFKYLGVHLDPSLSWDRHIQMVASKMSSMCGILSRISSFLPRKALLQFYFAHIHSHLTYVITSWGRACKSKLKKLQTIQNRCLKIIFKLPLLYSSNRLYSDSPHNILPVIGLCDEQTLLLVHKVLHCPAT